MRFPWTGRPYGYPRRNAFRQPLLEAQLKAALSRFDHVRTLYGWHLDHYEQEDRCVTVVLLGPAGERRNVTCDYLVGCDGASSRVREQQGVQLAGTTFDERWLIVDLENNENTTKHTEVFCDTRRPCITLPGPERTRRFEFKLLPGETDEDLLAPDMIAQLLASHGASPDARIRRKVVYRFHARVAPRWAFGRVFLAGDAAHLTPPFAGQGMNSGIRDAHNLAWKLAAVLNGRGGPALLDSYERERKAHIWEMIRLALRMGRVMSPKTRLHGTLMRSGFRSLRLWPTAAAYVAQMKYKPKPRFEAGFISREGERRNGLVGRLLPQPNVLAADGTSALLDHVLGNRFVLLALGPDASARLDALRHPVWDSLDAARVAVLPRRGAHPHVSPRVTIVVDADDGLAEVSSRYAGCALLLRPDHYVAAVVPLDRPDRAVREVEALLASTWAGSEARSGPATGAPPDGPDREAAGPPSRREADPQQAA